MRCLRCDWRSDPGAADGRGQLLNHADDAAHPVCLCCQRSLRPEEPRVCEPCLTESRSLLAGVAMMWAELPRHLGQLRGGGYDQTSRSSEKPLLGGDALVLAGPGSGGTGARVLNRHELGRGLVQGIDGREHHQDNRDVQAVSVAGVLTQWEDDWRHVRAESAAVVLGGTAASVRGAVGYLEVHGRWAANEHPDFDGYLDDLQIVHGRLEQATGRGDRTRVAEAKCLQCSGRLVKPVTDGGYPEHWVCDRCGREYEEAEYLLAMAHQLRIMAAGWSRPGHVAVALGVPFRTVQSWAHRGLVAQACLLEVDQDGRPVYDPKRKRMRGDKVMRVLYEEVASRVHRLAEERRRRDERVAAKAAS